MYRSAEDKRTSLLAGARPEGVYGDQNSDPDDLRAKIQQGIRVLQEGLLERGTEVHSRPRVSTKPGMLTLYSIKKHG